MSFRVSLSETAAVLHNFPLYLLSDIEDGNSYSSKEVESRALTLISCSDSGTKSIVISSDAPDNPKFRAMSMRALRLVTLRVPKAFMPHAHVPTYLLAYVTETLECGHKLDFFPVADPLTARRRNCPECAALPQRKPMQSVSALRDARAA